MRELTLVERADGLMEVIHAIQLRRKRKEKPVQNLRS